MVLEDRPRPSGQLRARTVEQGDRRHYQPQIEPVEGLQGVNQPKWQVQIADIGLEGPAAGGAEQGAYCESHET